RSSRVARPSTGKRDAVRRPNGARGRSRFSPSVCWTMSLCRAWDASRSTPAAGCTCGAWRTTWGRRWDAERISRRSPARQWVRSALTAARRFSVVTAVSFGFPAPGFLGPTHATMGTFDGIHRGHLALLRPLIADAKAVGAASVLVTFEPHPRCVLDPDHCPAN